MWIRACAAALLTLVSSPAAAPPTTPPPVIKQQCAQPQIILRRPGVNLAPNSTFYSDGMPPLRFRADNHTEVVFANPAEVERICGGGTTICGLHILACQKGKRLYMPNPCVGGGDSYSRLLCHELAHLNGWPATHGD